jgi:hypothetical protein
MTDRNLPAPLAPRLLCCKAAAAYCGMSAGSFTTYVAPHVAPLEFGRRRLWDLRMLDAWLDRRSRLDYDGPSLRELLQQRPQLSTVPRARR